MGKSRISIIIPCHNSARFIHSALDSLLNQTREAHEIIVIDDGSTDGLKGVVQPYRSKIIYRFQERKGVSSARNEGIRIASGDLIGFLDADDYFLPEKLEHQVGMLENHRTLGLVNSGWVIVDEGGREIEVVSPWHEVPTLDLRGWLFWKPVLPGALVVRKSWLEKIGGFDESLAHAEDVDLVLRMAHAGCKSAWLKEATLCYRQHGANVTRSGLEQSRSIERVLDQFFDLPELPKNILLGKGRIYYHTLIWSSWQLLAKGSIEPAVPVFRRAIGYSDLPASDALMQGLTEFGQWLRPHKDQAVRELFLVALKGNLKLDLDMDSDLSLSIVDWWASVWRMYTTHEWDSARQALATWKDRAPVPHRRYAQIAIMRKPDSDTCVEVAAFWEDCREFGLVGDDERHQVITLYLTVMTWAIYTRQWYISLQAWAHAISSSRHPRAVVPWLKFVRAALSYYAIGRRGFEKHRGMLAD